MRRVGGESFGSDCGLGQKAVATISLQRGIENGGHAGVGGASELSEKAAACIGDADGGWQRAGSPSRLLLGLLLGQPAVFVSITSPLCP